LGSCNLFRDETCDDLVLSSGIDRDLSRKALVPVEAELDHVLARHELNGGRRGGALLLLLAVDHDRCPRRAARDLEVTGERGEGELNTMSPPCGDPHSLARCFMSVEAKLDLIGSWR
jgi:hypothetical protein